jgi:hypothetical protein
MRIAYLSDLHLEFAAQAPPGGARLAMLPETALAPAAGADLVVLAGDIDRGEDGVAAADAIARKIGAPVVYVAGNHEAYNRDMTALLPRLRAAAWATDGRVHFLQKNIVRFWFSGRPLAVLGCVLWTDYAILGDAETAMRAAEVRMYDHQAIGWNGGPFLPRDAFALHRKERAWLAASIAKLKAETPPPKILIVTHHAPCRQAIGPRVYALAPSYASDVTDEISAWGSLTWIHGHTHHRHLTKIAEATVASAPCGYASEPGFGVYACGIMDL